MNNKEINEIQDIGLLEIRWKYWNDRHHAFLNENGISDQEIGTVFDNLTADEEKEVAAYLKKQEEAHNG